MKPLTRILELALFAIAGASPAMASSQDHYQFTGDLDFLREHLPVMEEAAEFYLTSLQKTSDGYLVTNPAVSFENT